MNQIRQYIASRLQPLYDGDELNALIWWMLEEITSKNRAILLAGAYNITLEDIQDRLDAIINRLLRHEPIQYIFGHTQWLGLDLVVTSDVLIPRPETAEMIDIVARKKPQVNRLRILDIGTGSGCLAIGLKKYFPQAEVVALDISEAALQIARENAKRNNAEVKFVRADALKLGIGNLELGINSSYDVIVSNPPYIAESECETMDVNVLDYEPHKALFVPDENPLVFYRAIAEFANNHLSSDGVLVLEINQWFGTETQALVQSVMPDSRVQLLQDSYGNDRFIVITI